AIVESALGMGLSRRQRLLRIELPLAWPIVLTGIRVSTVVLTGIAAIAIETNPVTEGYRARFRCVSAVQPDSRMQRECDAQTLSSFATYQAEDAFPRRR
ncbi:MAG: hypothetical protein AAFV49_02340, partial [Pseudomonadota bacterium]